VIDFSLQLSTDFSLQQLRRAVEPVKSDRRLAPALGGLDRRVLPVEHVERAQGIAGESDSLLLTRAQVAALSALTRCSPSASRACTASSASSSRAENGGAGKAELDSANEFARPTGRIFWEQPEIADSIVTSDAEGTVSDAAPYARHDEEGSRELPGAVRPPREDGAAAQERRAGDVPTAVGASHRPLITARLGAPQAAG
jgi:hypothetical protein